MAMSYNALVGAKDQVGSIKNWLNYGLIDADGVLEDAQSYIYGALRAREMRQSETVTVLSQAFSVAVPAGLIDMLSLRHAGAVAYEVTMMDERNLSLLREEGTVTGRPLVYTIYNERFQFEIKANIDYPLIAIYYKRLDLLGLGNSTNFLTTRYSALLRAACMMTAARFRNDDVTQASWKKQTDELLLRANIEADPAQRAG